MILQDKVSIITGGSMGIGKAIAAAFAREGSSMVLAARNARELELARDDLHNSSARVEIFQADVSCEKNVTELVEFTLEKYGTVDILLNCAGIYGPIGPITDIDSDNWIQAVNINLCGTFLCMKAVLPTMIKKGKGKIINMSGGGAASPFPRFSAYGASKAAVVRLTETVAAEVKDYNIGINAIAPGGVNTRLLDQVLDAQEAAGTEFYAKALNQKQEGGVPSEKVADLAIFLASPQSDGLSGRLLSLLWDSWRDIPQRLDTVMSSDVYTLRRIVPSERGYSW